MKTVGKAAVYPTKGDPWGRTRKSKISAGSGALRKDHHMAPSQFNKKILPDQDTDDGHMHCFILETWPTLKFSLRSWISATSNSLTSSKSLFGKEGGTTGQRIQSRPIHQCNVHSEAWLYSGCRHTGHVRLKAKKQTISQFCLFCFIRWPYV